MRAAIAVALGAVMILGGCLVDRAGRAAPDGDLPGIDAGRRDAGPGCAPSTETCDGSDDDCDGLVDEDFDLRSDRNHCGRCGVVCPVDPPNASVACFSGTCTPTCDPGFADCNEEPADGCEADLGAPGSCGSCETICVGASPFCTDGECTRSCGTDRTACEMACVDTSTNVSHCGGCGSVCPDRPNSSPACAGGVCGVSCDTGFADCDDDPANGCEVELATDPVHCGSCGSTCPMRDNATRTCAAATCGYRCDPGFGDCDGSEANGCEADTTADAAHCGTCGTVCASGPQATAACVSSVCALTCTDPDFGDCDGVASNGCEVDLTGDDAHCGSCGAACSVGSCVASACVAVCTDPDTADCDGDAANGCETPLGTDDDCRRCGEECSLQQSCRSGGCQQACGTTNCAGGCNNGCCNAGSCGGGDCTLSVTGGGSCRRTIDCRDGSTCDASCNDGASCAMDCRRTTTCTGDCTVGSNCLFECDDATDCTIQVSSDSRATVDCTGVTGDCGVQCNSQCLVYGCDGGGCDLTGGCTWMSCGDGAMVCGRSCP